jgi:hypothetical protein
MFIRTLALVAVMMIAVAACGGDEPAASNSSCTPNEMSVPNGPNDPCDQKDPACLMAKGTAYNTCLPTGVWADKCMCITPQTTPSTGQNMPAVTQQAMCGDTIITEPEKCDGNNLRGMDCRSMGYNGGGTLLCNPTTCQYDIIMCRMTTSGGAGQGGGAGMGGGGTGS